MANSPAQSGQSIDTSLRLPSEPYKSKYQINIGPESRRSQVAQAALHKTSKMLLVISFGLQVACGSHQRHPVHLASCSGQVLAVLRGCQNSIGMFTPIAILKFEGTH